MAHHKSAKKRILTSEKKRMNNKVKKSRVRGLIKNVRNAIAEGKKEDALKVFTAAQSALGRLSKGSAMHRNTAARLTSRLAKQISKLS